MGYAILRTKKIKTMGGVNLSLKHAYRDQITPNADPEFTPDNEMLVGQNRAEALQRFNERLSNVEGKIRKNGVLCVEYLVTGSPESIAEMTRQEQDDYFRKALEWIAERHGSENIISAGVHRDETTPHLYVHVVPMDRERNKLNCRAFLGGSDVLSAMQSDFHEKVAQNFGLERGIKGSKAKHTRIRDFYKNLNHYDTDKIDVSPKVVGYKKSMMGLKKEPIYESNEQVAKRLYEQHIKPIDDKVWDMRYKAKKAQDFSEFFEKYHKVNTSDLSDQQIAILSQKAEQFREEKRAFEKAKEEQERIADLQRRQKAGLTVMSKGKKGGMKI